MEEKTITHSITGRVFAVPVILSVVMGSALIGASAIAANAFYKIRALDNNLTVSGSAKTQVQSDTMKWSVVIHRQVGLTGLSMGIEQAQQNLAEFKTVVVNAGIPDTAITAGTLTYNKDYDYINGVQKERGYSIMIPVTINTTDIDKLVAVAGDPKAFLSRDIALQGNYIEYYYSKLAEARIALLADAMKDARARAEKIAGESGSSVGRIKSASSGVVQVLAPNSVDVSDYGTYDTQSRTKVIMVTTKATFQLQ
jgi:hypothetical protein